MTLTNYWWVLIWLFTAGVVCVYAIPQKREIVLGKPEYRWRWSAVLILAIPYVIWSGCRWDYFGDTAAYRATFRNAPESLSQIAGYLTEHTKDKGFSVLVIIVKSIFGNSDVLFFMIIAAFQMFCIVYVFRKYSSNFWISFFLFIVSTDYLSWMHNGVRQFIAVTMILACFGLLVKKKYVLLICIILLASTVHGTALIMIPVIFIVQGKSWNKKTVFLIGGIMVIMAFINQFTPVLDNMLSETQYSDLVSNEIWTSDDGANILRVLVYSVPALLALWGRKYVDQANDPIINISVNCSCITMALYLLSSVSSGIYIGRLPIYTTLMGYIAVPWLVEHVFSEESANLVRIAMVGLYLIFFYYQMHFTWGVI